MDARHLRTFRKTLLRRRQSLCREVAAAETDLQQIAEDRESELEERAQDERIARLLAQVDQRGQTDLEKIERALGRLDAGRYGVCEGCGRDIPTRRLAALPATPYCRDCVERIEHGEPLEAEPEIGPHPAAVPPDYSLLTGRELEEAVRDQLREDGRVDTEELRIVCRHGVVYLTGSLPSEQQHQILSHTLTDVMGLSEIVDRVQVKEILWEREDRSKEDLPVETKLWEESYGTEDITEADEQGVDFVPPVRPGPDEE